MKNILVLGAGQSAPYLIRYLLKEAEQHDWFVTVADLDEAQARERVADHPRGSTVQLDITDAALRSSLISQSDIVVYLLAPPFQHLVALDCVYHAKPMISASYRDHQIRELDRDAHRQGILILNEMGLDPGIDHMSAMRLIQKLKAQKAKIVAFKSYGGGLPAPEAATNPLRYCVTWNPRNIVRAGENGAQYMENGFIKILPYHNVFQRSWMVDVEGIGTLEAFPNRDSLNYQRVYGLDENLVTMIRGSLRYPGWSETWYYIVQLGLTNETLIIPDLPERTYREFVEMFLPIHLSGTRLEQRVANFLHISPTGKVMDIFRWLGLFSKQKIGAPVRTAAQVMIHLLVEKLKLPPGGRDMVVVKHEVDAYFPDQPDRKKRINSTLLDFGEPDGMTAIAKTVGLPAAVAAKLILLNKIPLTGSHLPTHPAIYQPVLNELEKLGLRFQEKIEDLEE